MTNRTTDGRYPYTYSCDYIRQLGPVSSKGVVLSRSDASQIRQGIAKAIGMEDPELAKKLADAQLEYENNPEMVQANVQKLLNALGYGS